MKKTSSQVSIMSPSAYVLNDCEPQDVAKSMIELGKQKQPFYIFDLDEAYERIQYFKNMMPRVKIFYSMKANDTDMMLKLAIATGLGFDCASPNEIHKLRRNNVPASSMIYSTPIKTPDQMKYAKETGIQHTTFDTFTELLRLKENWPDARLLLSVQVGSESKERKLGCDFHTEAVDLLEEAANLGLCVVGVAFHVDSLSYNVDSYRMGLRYARALFDHEAQAGRRMNIVDIGGGFQYDTFDQVSRLINREIQQYFPDPNVQIIAEPGRYFCDSAFVLYCSISNVRRVKRNDKTLNMIHINDGIYGTIRYSQNWHKLSKFKDDSTVNTSNLEETILWGPSCDSLDRVMEDFTVQLPRCTPDDWLVLTNHGAYTFSYVTKFSSLTIPLVRPVISPELWFKLKDNVAFSPRDFINNPDISIPLPMVMPPVAPKKPTCHLKNNFTLAC